MSEPTGSEAEPARRTDGQRAASPWTYQSILAKYLARGCHPLSAKAQADAWQEVQDQKRRRRAREALAKHASIPGANPGETRSLPRV